MSYLPSLAVAISSVLLSFSVAFAQQNGIIVEEWDVPTPNSAPHDIIVDPGGIAWYTGINSNKIGSFDPGTEQFLEFNVPTPSSRPHGLVSDENGNIWFTEMSGSKIGKLDVDTGEIEEFDTPTSNSGPHTPIIGNGVVWFTEIQASKIGRLDIDTGMIEEFSTPTANSSPYGIIVDQVGNAWYAALTGHLIGKVDAETGEITEYPTPTANSGTRRVAIDSEGKLWFTEYNAAKIGSFDPETEEFNEYDTNSPSSGPYAIWVDIYDNVWFSMTNVYKIGKFDQSTNTINEYDLPTPRTVIRFLYSDQEGRIWIPNNSNNKIGVITQTSAQDPGQLMITEVEFSSPNGSSWAEIYNPTDDQIILDTLYVNSSSGNFSQALGSLDLSPNSFRIVELNPPNNSSWTGTYNSLVLYSLATDVGDSQIWYKTPELTDSFEDSQTWQLNGTQWTFAEETPLRVIPEFTGVSVLVAAAIFGIVMIVARTQVKTSILSRVPKS